MQVKMSATLVYSMEEPPQTYSKSIFLAGPTPRKSKETGLRTCQSWRPQLIEQLELAGYDGVIYSPEDREGTSRENYDHQIDWELENLYRADQIIFWVPRAFPEMPALTTNIEFGEWYRCGRLIMGWPPNTAKMGYFKHRAADYMIPSFDSQQAIVEHVLKDCEQTRFTQRTGSFRNVPISVYNSPSFANFRDYCFKTSKNRPEPLWDELLDIKVRAEYIFGRCLGQTYDQIYIRASLRKAQQIRTFQGSLSSSLKLAMLKPRPVRV